MTTEFHDQKALQQIQSMLSRSLQKTMFPPDGTTDPVAIIAEIAGENPHVLDLMYLVVTNMTKYHKDAMTFLLTFFAIGIAVGNEVVFKVEPLPEATEQLQ